MRKHSSYPELHLRTFNTRNAATPFQSSRLSNKVAALHIHQEDEEQAYAFQQLYQFRFLNMTMSKPIQIAGQGRTTSNSWLLRGVLTQNQRFGMAAQFMFRRRN
ncbi:hypothetical protein GZ77_04040 [Endozoicomonas montiporae]|uniref:Uncharacterized protein n=1 Tax=Endozoicomonas montiporae TaxID=1027273 RepID=A0A081NBB0_9GAMM|nr:hypothetical protein GZ77_04040 [Endozoicomonas montiporae]